LKRSRNPPPTLSYDSAPEFHYVIASAGPEKDPAAIVGRYRHGQTEYASSKKKRLLTGLRIYLEEVQVSNDYVPVRGDREIPGVPPKEWIAFGDYRLCSRYRINANGTTPTVRAVFIRDNYLPTCVDCDPSGTPQAPLDNQARLGTGFWVNLKKV
jgi:hypothetical protein